MGDHRLLLCLLKGMMQPPAEKTGGKHSFLKTVQAKQCSPPKTGFCKKKSTILPTKYRAFFGGEYRAVSNHGELLQSMHGALPAELMPHSFGTNKSSGQTKKHHTLLCGAFPSGGEYRDRTGDLLHAMQALSRTVSKHTPHTKVRGQA